MSVSTIPRLNWRKTFDFLVSTLMGKYGTRVCLPPVHEWLENWFQFYYIWIQQYGWSKWIIFPSGDEMTESCARNAIVNYFYCPVRCFSSTRVKVYLIDMKITSEIQCPPLWSPVKMIWMNHPWLAWIRIYHTIKKGNLTKLLVWMNLIHERIFGNKIKSSKFQMR